MPSGDAELAAYVWSGWNYTYYTASTMTSTATTDTVWYHWNTDYTSSATSTLYTTSTAVWAQWNGQYWVNYEPYQEQQQQPVIVVQPTEEQLRVQREAIADAKRIADEIEARAEAILLRSLDEQQQAEFKKDRTFRVISKDGQRQYRIRKGTSHNIERIDEAGRRIHTLCAHPVEYVPEYDNMLVQKLYLEHDEESFLRVANVGRRA